MKESLKKFKDYYYSEEKLMYYFRTTTIGWNDESFTKMKQIVREVMKDYEKEDYYPKIFLRYMIEIESMIDIMSRFKECTDEELEAGYTVETYKERIRQLKEIKKEFVDTLLFKSVEDNNEV